MAAATTSSLSPATAPFSTTAFAMPKRGTLSVGPNFDGGLKAAAATSPPLKADAVSPPAAAVAAAPVQAHEQYQWDILRPMYDYRAQFVRREIEYYYQTQLPTANSNGGGPSTTLPTLNRALSLQTPINNTKAISCADEDKLTCQHYNGHKAVQDALALLRLSDDESLDRIFLLDAGAGFGGQARYVASEGFSRRPVSVLAVEFNPNFVEIGKELLAHRTDIGHDFGSGCRGEVRLVSGDLTKLPRDPVALGVPAAGFDGGYSFLVFMHIPEKAAWFATLAALLRDGARFVIEDFFSPTENTADQQARAVSAENEQKLRNKVSCATPLSTVTSYTDLLRSVGLRVVHFEDMTAVWTDFTQRRTNAFLAAHERNVRVHRGGGAESLRAVRLFEEFYAVVAELFACGAIRGGRIVVEKPRSTC